MTRRSASARERILDAAECELTERGGSNFTLEAVASRSNVSKGGLLYHFPTKDVLMLALAERYTERLRPYASRSSRPGASCSDETGASEFVLQAISDESSARTLGSILRAAAADAGLLAIIRDHIVSCARHWSGQESKFARMAVITLAVEGMMFREALRISPFTSEQRTRVIKELLALGRD